MSLNRLVLPANLEGRGYHCRGGGSIFFPVVVSTSAESKATGLRVNEYCANIPINQLFAKAEVPPSAFQPLDKVLYMKEEMYFAGLITQAADKGRFQVVKMTGREDRQAIPLKHVAPLVEPPTTESLREGARVLYKCGFNQFIPAAITKCLDDNEFDISELYQDVPFARLAAPVTDMATLNKGKRILVSISKSCFHLAVITDKTDDTCDLTEVESCKVPRALLRSRSKIDSSDLRPGATALCRSSPSRPLFGAYYEYRINGIDGDTCSLSALSNRKQEAVSAGDLRPHPLEEGRVYTVVRVDTARGMAQLDGIEHTIPLKYLLRARLAHLLVQDFAGQDEYYITHSLFLTSRVLITICFQLSRVDDEDTFEREVLFFLRNIRARVPNVKVLLVGTKCDLLKGGATEIKAKQEFVMSLIEKEVARENLQRLRSSTKQHVELPAMPDCVFAVSSGPSLTGFDELRAVIKESIGDRAAFPDLGAHVPRPYMILRDNVRALRASNKKPILGWDEYAENVAPNNIGDLRTATSFLHSLGELLYYADTDLADTVFPSPGFLIDMMKYVIRHDHQEALRMDSSIVDGMTPADFSAAKQDFLRRGILSHRLLARMWAPLHLPEEQFRVLVQLLEQFEIALP